jgi:hypothetical protein
MNEESVETLKPLDQFLKEDFRNTILAYQNPLTKEWRRQDLTDLHRLAAHAKLGQHVEGKIRSHFAMAQNLALYAWFHFPFHMASQLHAFSTLEFALREVLKPGDGREATLFGMLQRSARQQLITDKGMVLHPTPKPQAGKYLAMVIVKGSDGVRRRENQWFDHWVETLPHYLPARRNDLAHGSTTLWDDPSVLWICADLINQVYLHAAPSAR